MLHRPAEDGYSFNIQELAELDLPVESTISHCLMGYGRSGTYTVARMIDNLPPESIEHTNLKRLINHCRKHRSTQLIQYSDQAYSLAVYAQSKGLALTK